MERQTILERLGWRFIRIRGSEYFRNPEGTMGRVFSEIESLDIHSTENCAIEASPDTDLLTAIKTRAEELLAIDGFGFDAGDSKTAIEAALSSDNDTYAATFKADTHYGKRKDAGITNNKTISPVPAQLQETGKHEQPERTLPRSQATPERTLPSSQTTPMRTLPSSQTTSNRTLSRSQATPERVSPRSQTTPVRASSRSQSTLERTLPRSQSSSERIKSAAPTKGQMTLFDNHDTQDNPHMTDVIELFKQAGIKYVDNRPSKGALWIIGGMSLAPFVKKCSEYGLKFMFKKGGGRATGNKDAWWAK